MTKRRILILLLGVCVLAGGVAVAVLAKDGRLRAKPRREWKDQAIGKMERRFSDRRALEAEVSVVANALATTRPAPAAWVGDTVLVMKNGNWIAYENICSKEDSRIHDLFLGRGSDGKWYYSTFHFCRDMATLRFMEEWQPESLAQFIDAYWLVPFDGCSDECLKATWTFPEPYGQERLQMAGTTKPVQ